MAVIWYDFDGKTLFGGEYCSNYIMDENLLHVRAALRKASDKKLGDDFWQRVLEEIEKKGQV